jgi:hypothetical protein
MVAFLCWCSPVDVWGLAPSLGLGQYEAVFRYSEIDPEFFRDLIDADFEKLGVPPGHRKDLRKAIAI